MSKLDKLIEQSLDAEDRALLAQYGEQGMLGMVGELFAGKARWWVVLTTAVQIGLFAAALYAAVQFFAAADPVIAIRWGIVASVWFMAMATIKIMHWQQMQANRVIREVKRVELQLARSKAA